MVQSVPTTTPIGASRPRISLLATCAVVVLVGARAAGAETLADAIALAYQSNPTLQSQRIQLQGVDETDVQARAGLSLTAQIEVTGGYNQDLLGKNRTTNAPPNPNFRSHVESNAGDAQIVLTQPLYSGGRVASAVREADNKVRAGRESLRAVEGNIVFAVIQAYADVRRDEQALDVRRLNLDVLVKQASETKARQRAGEVTGTDVAQADAQLASEHALLAAAEGQLQISRAEYAAVVGQNPGSLAPEPRLPGLPKEVDEAFSIAESASPEMRQALFSERESEAHVAAVRAEYRPSVSVHASFGYSAALEPFGNRGYDRAFAAQAVLTQPLYTGGVNASQIRAALDQNTADRIGIEGARRTVVQNIANAWNQMLTARLTVTAQQLQIKAAAIAFEGMKVEYRAGQRSTLDVLIAEETLRDAEIALLNARHDEYVATAVLLRYMGRLEARALITGLAPYDPADHLRRVQNVGAAPWTPLLTRVDAIGAPSVDSSVIPAPRPATTPKMAATDEPIATHIELLKADPTTPVPGTVGTYVPTPIRVPSAYVKLSGGANFQGREHWNTTDYEMMDGFDFGAAGGLFVSPKVSIEADVLHTDAEYRCCKTHLSSNGILVDGLYHFDTTAKLDPYVGLGIGMIDVQYSGGGNYWTDWVLGGQVLAGAELPLTERISAFAEYRYQLAAKARHGKIPFDYRSQNLLSGVKIVF